jgi:hypothetical protein
MAYRKLPWEQIKADYIFGIEQDGQRIYPSIRELARRYKIGSKDTILRHIQKEGWNKEREKYRDRIRTESGQKVVQKITDKLTDINMHGVDGGLEMMQAARLILRGCVELYKNAQQLPTELPERVEILRGLSITARALQQMHKGGLEAARLAIGEPTEISDERITLEQFWAEVSKYAEYIEAEKIEASGKSGSHGA